MINDFKQCKTYGEFYEDLFIKRMSEEYDIIQIIKKYGYYPYYDVKLKTPYNIIRYEVKASKLNDVYESFFIEYMHHGQKSGILKTRAKYYVLTYKGSFIVVNVKYIKLIIENKKYYSKRFTESPRGITKGYIITYESIKHYIKFALSFD